MLPSGRRHAYLMSMHSTVLTSIAAGITMPRRCFLKVARASSHCWTYLPHAPDMADMPITMFQSGVLSLSMLPSVFAGTGTVSDLLHQADSIRDIEAKSLADDCLDRTAALPPGE